MGGTNPYNKPVEFVIPKKGYSLTVNCDGQDQTFEVDPTKIPYGHDGFPGSILDILLGNGIDVDHACGGVCACSTCHVYVEKGMNSCNEASEDEEDMLDQGRAIRNESRLSCQCVPDGTEDVYVRIPEWNRNLAKESPH